ncbi:hypothetical protein ACN47E_007648 [Coniothyrium glycines]
MRLAEILSDLVSLRVCPPAAALALVSAHRPSPTSSATSTSPATPATNDDENDTDLTRARELVKLHYEVKQAHGRGELSRGLEEARRSVDNVVGG